MSFILVLWPPWSLILSMCKNMFIQRCLEEDHNLYTRLKLVAKYQRFEQSNRFRQHSIWFSREMLESSEIMNFRQDWCSVKEKWFYNQSQFHQSLIFTLLHEKWFQNCSKFQNLLHSWTKIWWYKCLDQFKNIARSVFTYRMLMKDNFRKADRNQDGRISMQEIMTTFQVTWMLWCY